MDVPDAGVYGEAKGEYTRQLCVFLVPSLESFFLDLLNEAKQTTPSPSKELLTFQNLLQNIPDWNQDKVIRETTRIQQDTKCDYLEELLTAVFIAHTKVLSAIRLTSKQKKLQITIPKLDHFLHRVLSESARSLWTNAYLFSGSSSLEKQKNLRQVAQLLQEAILQAIRGLLPVKSILREYLIEEEDEPEPAGTAIENTPQIEQSHEQVEAKEEIDQEKPIDEEVAAISTVRTPTTEEIKPESDEKPFIEVPPSPQPVSVNIEEPPIVHLDSVGQGEAGEAGEAGEGSKPSVQFNDKAMVFSENGLEEVDLIEEEPPMESIESISIGADLLPMDGFEDLDKPSAPSPIEFEELP